MKWSCPIIFICHLIFKQKNTEYPFLGVKQKVSKY